MQPLVDHVSSAVAAYQPNYLSTEAADELFDWLTHKVTWQQETLSMFGRQIKVPRQVAWFGETGINYPYAGSSHIAQGWPPQLDVLRQQLSVSEARPLNFVLLNQYCCGSQYMGWHRDDEPCLQGAVVSLSVGAPRRFLIEAGTSKRAGAAIQKCRLELAHGSLLRHPGGWRHTLPKTTKPIGTRINLSFRYVCAD